MKRILIVSSVVVLLQTGVGFSLTAPQRTVTTTTLRRIQVNARMITALPRAKKYVVNLTQRGVKYEFDCKDGQIDFNRVMVRTAKGDVTVSSFLESNFSKEQLAEFKLNSHSFILGTPTKETPPTDTASEARLGFTCGSISCDCVGDWDCGNLIFRSRRCKSMIFCWTGDDGRTHCHCRQLE